MKYITIEGDSAAVMEIFSAVDKDQVKALLTYPKTKLYGIDQSLIILQLNQVEPKLLDTITNKIKYRIGERLIMVDQYTAKHIKGALVHICVNDINQGALKAASIKIAKRRDIFRDEQTEENNRINPKQIQNV